VMHTVTNDMFEITPLNFDKKWHTVNIYLGDRFYFPRPMDAVINGKKVEIKEADTKEKFLIINKELIDVLKQSGELF